MAQSINPYTQEVLATYPDLNSGQLAGKIAACSESQRMWRQTGLQARIDAVRPIAELLRSSKKQLAILAAKEMGKPVSQGLQEIEKCAWAIGMLCDQASDALAPRSIRTDAGESFVQYDPMGVILGIMPWNYPYWQVVRFAIPALISGNGIVLKHASNVTGSALALEEIIKKSNLPADIFKVLVLKSSDVEFAINHPEVRMITLTGSDAAGRAVAASSGKAIKPSVLELGGNNAFVVMADADIDRAVDDAVVGRFQNSGQSCIAAKRILLHESIEQGFTEKFAAKVKKLWVGDPQDPQCYVGPLARVDLAADLHDQVERSMASGAKLLVGGRFQKATYAPTILTDVRPGMAAFDEETFGPVSAITTFKYTEEMIDLVNGSKYGLGVSVYTSDVESAKEMSHLFDEGAVFVNSIVKSDPRLPFGGTKISGYGRELGEEGLLSFVNKKTIYVQ